jgi:hypothetical protein
MPKKPAKRSLLSSAAPSSLKQNCIHCGKVFEVAFDGSAKDMYRAESDLEEAIKTCDHEGKELKLGFKDDADHPESRKNKANLYAKEKN